MVAERIRRAFLTVDLPLAEGVRRPAQGPLATLSLGVASTGAGETLFFDTLLAQTEHARDAASSAGGDRVEVFSRDRFVDHVEKPDAR